MNPDLDQTILRHNGEGYTLAFTVNLEDEQANAASISAPKLWVGGVTIDGEDVTVTDTDTSGFVDVSVTIAPATFSELTSGTYIFELSLVLGGDPAVVAGGTFALDRSRNLEAGA